MKKKLPATYCDFEKKIPCKMPPENPDSEPRTNCDFEPTKN